MTDTDTRDRFTRTVNDRRFLEFIANRLVTVHGESPNTDYVRRLLDLARHLPDPARIIDDLARALPDTSSPHQTQHPTRGLAALVPHIFVGRLDRDCELCGRPDRHPLHDWDGEPPTPTGPELARLVQGKDAAPEDPGDDRARYECSGCGSRSRSRRSEQDRPLAVRDETPNAVGVPSWLVDRMYAARGDGFPYACLYCGAGLDDDRQGDHADDCTRPFVRGERVKTIRTVALEGGLLRRNQRGIVTAVAEGAVGFSWVDEDGSHVVALESESVARIHGLDGGGRTK